MGAITARLPRDPRARVAWLCAAAGLLLTTLVLAISAEAGRAAVAPATSPELGRPEAPAFPLGVELILKLGFVIALIYAIAAVARRYLLNVPTTSHRLIHVLDGVSIGPKRNLHVVEIAGRVLVLGSTEASVTSLTEFDDPDRVADLLANARPTGIDFQRYLAGSLRRGAAVDVLPLDRGRAARADERAAEGNR
jgi:flagellar protein FliO/FliZ